MMYVCKLEKKNIFGHMRYHMRAIITRGLYTFYPLFQVQKRFLRSFLFKILALCMVSIQERFLIMSRLYCMRMLSVCSVVFNLVLHVL